MNAIEVLKEDHRRVKKLFGQYDSADGDKGEIVQSVFRELEMHTRVEEDIFYPAVRANSDKSGKGMIKHNFDEHQEFEDLIRELREMEVTGPDFDDKFEELVEDVEHHIDLEESETFPMAEAVLGKQLEELGREILEEKEVIKPR